MFKCPLCSRIDNSMFFSGCQNERCRFGQREYEFHNPYGKDDDGRSYRAFVKDVQNLVDEIEAERMIQGVC